MSNDLSINPATAPVEKDPAYQKLWRMVDGAVIDGFKNHSDYLTPKGRRSAKNSIVKRVTGTVWGFANQARGRGNAAAKDDHLLTDVHQVSTFGSSEQAGGALLRPRQSIPKLHAVHVKHKPGWTRAFRHELQARIETHYRLVVECKRKSPV
jgi:hypothetical protein